MSPMIVNGEGGCQVKLSVLILGGGVEVGKQTELFEESSRTHKQKVLGEPSPCLSFLLSSCALSRN
jgi:hypothetical protein